MYVWYSICERGFTHNHFASMSTNKIFPVINVEEDRPPIEDDILRKLLTMQFDE